MFKIEELLNIGCQKKVSVPLAYDKRTKTYQIDQDI